MVLVGTCTILWGPAHPFLEPYMAHGGRYLVQHALRVPFSNSEQKSSPGAALKNGTTEQTGPKNASCRLQW
jgi:hypothetical protein